MAESVSLSGHLHRLSPPLDDLWQPWWQRRLVSNHTHGRRVLVWSHAWSHLVRREICRVTAVCDDIMACTGSKGAAASVVRPGRLIAPPPPHPTHTRSGLHKGRRCPSIARCSNSQLITAKTQPNLATAAAAATATTSAPCLRGHVWGHGHADRKRSRTGCHR